MKFSTFASLAALVAAGLLGGCSNSSSVSPPSNATTVTRTSVITATVQPTVTLTVTATPEPDPSAFPAGYPKKVAISKIPSQMHDEANGAKEAIAIAPGVWTALAPGTTVLESATYGTRFGYCSSIKAYEAKFTAEQVGNSCW